MMHTRTMDEKEKAILRAAVEELQMEGDEKLMIGKLHHHILTLQISEGMALRKLESSNEKCLKLESTIAEVRKAIVSGFTYQWDNPNILRAHSWKRVWRNAITSYSAYDWIRNHGCGYYRGV